MPHPTPDPILTRFRKALAEIYGERLTRVVLFGSRARNEANTDSDVAVFLTGTSDRWSELDRLPRTTNGRRLCRICGATDSTFYTVALWS